MADLLNVEHLSVSFFTPAGEAQAVRDVSFSLKAGEVLAIVGESGCGKSVLCKSILRLLPQTAKIKSGKIIVDGTDTMGRDIFSMIWYGGRLSLFIGVGSTVISTLLAILFGAVSGLAPKWLDALLMRLTEILLSVPNLLLVIFLQAVIGTTSAWSIALVIGLTSWTSIAKVVRTEVQQLRASEYVIAAKCMGGSFFHILRCHLAPNFFSSILFMVVMNVRSAIIAESTLSFMGLGLPIEVVTWGSMLSLAEKALMTDAWWILLIPGAFLVVTLLCITTLGDYLRSRTSRKESNL